MTDGPLKGVCVLVTRPRAQADTLIDAITRNGGVAISLPVIEIVPRDATAIASDAARLPPADIAVFVSSNAVANGLSYAENALTAAIGPATAAAIEAAGKTADITPTSGYDSESLLREAALQDVRGKQIRIIRGTDGRELLAETLRERGANVSYLAVYERILPSINVESLHDIEKACLAGTINAITIMSIETLNNLLSAVPESLANELIKVPLVTPAARVIKEVLDRFPASRPVLAPGTQANDMVEAIIALKESNP